MTHGDPRGPNVIPINYPLTKRSIEVRRIFGRRQDQLRPAPAERPWPFNALGPSPYNRATLPPVAAKPFVNTRHDGVRLMPIEEWGDKFNFREDMEINDRHELEMSIDCVLIQYKHDHPELRPLDLVAVLLKIVKKLMRMAKLPSR